MIFFFFPPLVDRVIKFFFSCKQPSIPNSVFKNYRLSVFVSYKGEMRAYSSTRFSARAGSAETNKFYERTRIFGSRDCGMSSIYSKVIGDSERSQYWTFGLRLAMDRVERVRTNKFANFYVFAAHTHARSFDCRRKTAGSPRFQWQLALDNSSCGGSSWRSLCHPWTFSK